MCHWLSGAELLCFLACMCVCVCVCSGADLKALVREAAIMALKDHMKLTSSHWVSTDQSARATAPSPTATATEGSKVDRGTECTVTMQHFLRALDRVRPSVSDKVIS